MPSRPRKEEELNTTQRVNVEREGTEEEGANREETARGRAILHRAGGDDNRNDEARKP